jgi:hypothetical protein
VSGVRDVIARCVTAMPMHQEFIDKFCKAAPLDMKATMMPKEKMPA